MVSVQTRQALRVLWWRGLDRAEDVGRFVVRRPRVCPGSPLTQSGLPKLSTEELSRIVAGSLSSNPLDTRLTEVHDGPMTNENAPFVEASVNVTHGYIRLDVGKTKADASIRVDVDQAREIIKQLESAINAYYAA